MADGKPTAVLTKTQREYLQGDREPTQERTMKTRMRNRVKQSFRDFSLLFEYWPQEEREKVFFNVRDDNLDVAVVDLLALIYGETKVGDSFKNLLLRAVNKAERRAAGTDELMVTTNFEVEKVETVNLQEAVEKYLSNNLDEMTEAEKKSVLRVLRRSETVSNEDVEASLEERVEQMQKRIDKSKADRVDHWRKKQKRARESSPGGE